MGSGFDEDEERTVVDDVEEPTLPRCPSCGDINYLDDYSDGSLNVALNLFSEPSRCVYGFRWYYCANNRIAHFFGGMS